MLRKLLLIQQMLRSQQAVNLEYEVGTMIEIPRAALTADEIAKEADFFCFGTNDLTQMTFGFSRDDAGKFLNAYYDTKIFENDPFAKLDQTGVGKLMDMAIKLGNRLIRTFMLVSVVSTVEILHLLSSATRSVWIMYPAHRSVCRSLVYHKLFKKIIFLK